MKNKGDTMKNKEGIIYVTKDDTNYTIRTTNDRGELIAAISALIQYAISREYASKEAHHDYDYMSGDHRSAIPDAFI